jgi:hypothetical protein
VVLQWQEVFNPLDPCQTIVMDGNTLPVKIQRQIDRGLAFNAREVRQRAIRKELQEKEGAQKDSQIIIGQVRPITPQRSEGPYLISATPIYPYEMRYVLLS